MSDRKKSSITVRGRLIGGNVYEKDEDGKYRVLLVLQGGEEAAKKITDSMNQVIFDKWGNNAPSNLQVWGPRYGDDQNYTDSFGKWFLTAKSSIPPRLLCRDKQNNKYRISDRDEDLFYLGVYVFVNLEPYAYDANPQRGFKAGITLSLQGLLYWRAGERLSWFNPEEAFSHCDDAVDPKDEAAPSSDYNMVSPISRSFSAQQPGSDFNDQVPGPDFNDEIPF